MHHSNPVIYKHTIEHRVRYGETDQMGYVYYGNYAQYCEAGRVELIRSLGMTYSDMEKSGIAMPVVSMNVQYLRPVFYDDLITITTYIPTIPDKNITFHTDIFNGQDKLTTKVEVTLCFYDIEKKKTVQCPESLISLLGKAH
jgi:acyl-CoA thioester hydrolase